MALERLAIDGYGQVELNNVAFRRDGRIEAQCAPDSTDFSNKVVENGMLLAVDAVNRTIKLAVDDSLPIALNYSAEHMYDERKPGLKNFYLNGVEEDFYPRLGYLAVGDKFHSNCIAVDSTEFSNLDALKSAANQIATTPLYGGACALGAIAVSSTAPTYGPVLKVIENATMPDGQFGLKFQVIAD